HGRRRNWSDWQQPPLFECVRTWRHARILSWCGWMSPLVIGSNRIECRTKKAHRHHASSGDGGRLVTRLAVRGW
ncbi:hypothetical protein PgNI_06430, partial [Pyricularia grisea]|uniref:Uncharacterized protein n=1 Tax=Pyricularia grisea TaxID=148305 RepID=A0A6P8B6B6_PYRGI